MNGRKKERLKAGDWIILSGFGGGAYLWGKPAEMADIEKKAREKILILQHKIIEENRTGE